LLAAGVLWSYSPQWQTANMHSAAAASFSCIICQSYKHAYIRYIFSFWLRQDDILLRRLRFVADQRGAIQVSGRNPSNVIYVRTLRASLSMCKSVCSGTIVEPCIDVGHFGHARTWPKSLNCCHRKTVMFDKVHGTSKSS
jgi:hypothetical protein